MTENLTNFANSTLNGAITNSATTLVITSATGFPAANFRIVVQDSATSTTNRELMLVTNVSGTTFTVTRGIESTSGVAHGDLSYIAHVLTAAGLAQTITEGGTGSAIDLSAGTLRLPSGTGALTATEAYTGWQSTTKRLRLYDTQRERSISPVGWTPRALPVAFDNSAALTTAIALAANGGSLAVAMLVPAHMLLQQVRVRNTDTATARTWGWDLYEQRLNDGNSGENTLDRVAACASNETFTPSAASVRTLAVGSAPVYLPPGVYYLVLQSRHATSTFGVGSTAAAALAASQGQTKTTTNPNGANLDFVAATWVQTTAIIAAVMDGRVFGMTSAL
jgi:hypothetical protein